MRFPVFLLRRREDAPEAPWLRAAVGVYLEHLVQRPYHGFPVRLPVHPETLVIEDGQLYFAYSRHEWFGICT